MVKEQKPSSPSPYPTRLKTLEDQRWHECVELIIKRLPPALTFHDTSVAYETSHASTRTLNTLISLPNVWVDSSRPDDVCLSLKKRLDLSYV